MSDNKILKIEEVENRKKDGWGSEQGFVVKTTKQVVSVLIDNDSSCCENWGYAISEDDPNKFLKSELLSVAIVDTGLNEKMVGVGKGVYDGDVMFVNFNTDQGTFQVAVYNEHNGYYGHEARVTISEVVHSEVL